MDNALLACTSQFTLALFVIVAVAPLSSSAVAMALWSALSLALSAHIAWRKSSVGPGGGEVIRSGAAPRGSGSWSLRLALVVRGRDAPGDGLGQSFLSPFNRQERDPRDPLGGPARPLACCPRAGARLTSYLVDVVMSAWGLAAWGRALGLHWGGVGGLVRLLLGG